ncbi:glycosyltransferase [Vibrio cionasavignyae]|uniref:glycosyltransferase n=1 Tax=Vibrio cionasavignyae TaxID=2910252 RepID=UPI003D0E4E8A
MLKNDTNKFVVFVDSVGGMGGTRSFLLKLLDYYYQNDFQTLLVIQKQQLDSRLLDYCEDRNIQLLKLPTRSDIFKKTYFSVLYDVYAYFLLRCICKPKVILATIGTPRLFSGLFFFSSPLIYFLHTCPNPATIKVSFMDKLVKLFVSKKKRFITVSQYAKSKINANMLIDPKFIDVIYNSAPISPSIADTKLCKVVLSVGHLNDYKNPFTWYKVAKEIVKTTENVRFIWVGEGPLLTTLNEQVIKDGLSEHIELCGLRHNMSEIYQQASILFHPSYVESHGIAIVEAMSFSLPCVASNAGGIPESIIHNETGYLCEPNDSDDFVIKIKELLSNEDKAILFGINGRSKMMNEFSESSQENAIINIVSDLSRT